MFIVQEIQTNNGIPALLPPETYESKQSAEQAYHYKLSFAASSNIQLHTVMIYDEFGSIKRAEYYTHPVAEPEPSDGEEA